MIWAKLRFWYSSGSAQKGWQVKLTPSISQTYPQALSSCFFDHRLVKNKTLSKCVCFDLLFLDGSIWACRILKHPCGELLHHEFTTWFLQIWLIWFLNMVPGKLICSEIHCWKSENFCFQLCLTFTENQPWRGASPRTSQQLTVHQLPTSASQGLQSRKKIHHLHSFHKYCRYSRWMSP